MGVMQCELVINQFYLIDLNLYGDFKLVLVYKSYYYIMRDKSTCHARHKSCNHNPRTTTELHRTPSNPNNPSAQACFLERPAPVTKAMATS